MCRTLCDTWAQFILMSLFCVTSIAKGCFCFCLILSVLDVFCFISAQWSNTEPWKKRENTENNGTWLFKMWCWAVWDASGIKVVITGDDLNGSYTVQMFWNQFLQESLFLFSVFFWNLLMLLITVWTFNTTLFSVNWRFVCFGQNHWFVQKKKKYNL